MLQRFIVKSDGIQSSIKEEGRLSLNVPNIDMSSDQKSVPFTDA